MQIFKQIESIDLVLSLADPVFQILTNGGFMRLKNPGLIFYGYRR